METRQALVFDYDGVLADTEVLHWKSWAAFLKQYGVGMDWEDYCELGRGVEDVRFCEVMREKWPALSAADLSNGNVERKKVFRRWIQEELPISRETIQLLSTLSAYRVGLVTSSSRSDVEPVLRAASIYERFDARVFGGDVAAHKPAPDPYLLIARKLGVPGGTAFEDSDAGIASARAAGFQVVRIGKPADLPHAVGAFLRGEKIAELNGCKP